jgi:predicted alpha/beta-fold hydrolase
MMATRSRDGMSVAPHASAHAERGSALSLRRQLSHRRQVSGPISCYGGADAEWHAEVLRFCPSLETGCDPSWYLRSAHLQNAMTVLRGNSAPALRWEREDRLTMPDGGTVSVQWTGLAADAATPVLVLLHTITGSGDDLRRFIASLRKRLGWVVAVCNRRGHGGLELTAPRINTLGSTDDLRLQLALIQQRRPAAALYGVGVSAGSGLIVRYLGEEGAQSMLRAGVALCPAYDIRDAFRYANRAYDRYLTRRLVEFFLRRNHAALAGVDGFENCAASRTLTEFHDRLFPLAGFASRDEYYLHSNPMEVAHGVDVPVLVINAADDPVCVERNVRTHLAALRGLRRMSLAVTRHGGHCGFFESRASQESWSDRVIAEYFLATHRLLGEKVPI